MTGPTPRVACPHTPVGTTPTLYGVDLASSLQANALAEAGWLAVIGASARASLTVGTSFVLEQGKRTNGGTWVEPTVEACSP
jgi:hypothetical protein